MKIGIYFVGSELTIPICIGNGNVLILDETGQGRHAFDGVKIFAVMASKSYSWAQLKDTCDFFWVFA